MLLLLSLEICFAWAVIAITLIGIGSIVLARFAKDYSPLDAFWMGFAISVALLQVWNLLLPITGTTTVLLFCLALLGLLANRAVIFGRLITTLLSSPALILFAGAVVLLIAVRSAGPCDYYDTGLYGAQAVSWIQTYSAVPGLANLYGRLGINSSVFLFIAAIGQGVWHGLAHHLFGGFMMAAFCVTILPVCVRVAAKSSATPADWFHTILTIPAIFWATRSRIVGTLTDEPAAIACLIAAGIFLETFSQSREKSEENPAPSRLLLAATLLSLAVTIKLSTVVFALLAWCLIIRRISLLDRSAQKRTASLIGAVALSTLILLPWCARNLILTGYPFFPATVLGFPVDWRVPHSVTKWLVTAVRSWGRMPDAPAAEIRGLAWFPEWLHRALRDRASFQVPLGVSIAGLAMGLSGLIRRGPRHLYPWLWLLLPSLVGIAFWFLISPDMRFGQFAIWTTAGTLGAWGIVSVTLGRRAVYSRAVFAMLMLSLVWCLVSFGWLEPYRSLLTARELQPLPKPDLIVRHTSSGVAGFVPAHGNQCWDAPLPCTPYFDDTLRLRDSSTMRRGFTSEGRAAEIQLPGP
jgi:hypothetical protein